MSPHPCRAVVCRLQKEMLEPKVEHRRGAIPHLWGAGSTLGGVLSWQDEAPMLCPGSCEPGLRPVSLGLGREKAPHPCILAVVAVPGRLPVEAEK